MTRQVLGAMVVVSILSSLIASVGMGFIWTQQIKKRYRNEIHRVAQILRSSAFPLNRKVLEQVKGLSGMEFVSLSANGTIIDSTLMMSERDQSSLRFFFEGDDIKRSPIRESTIDLAGSYYQVMVVPLVGNRGGSVPVSCVVILREQTALLRELRRVILPTITAAAVAIGVGLLLSIGIARHITRPLVDLTEQTIKAAHDLQSDITLPKVDDETHNLAKAIQHLITERRDYEQTVRNEAHLQAAHQFALGLGHQLRNLLTALRMALELHSERCESNRDDEDLSVAMRQVRLIDSVLRQFLSLRAFNEFQKEPLNYTHIVEEVLDLLRPAFRHAGVKIQVDLAQQPCTVLGHAISLEQLTTNLIMNAVEAVQGSTCDPTIRIALRQWEGRVQLVVEDNGPGPPSGVEKDLLNKPVTTKRGGIGLGLFVAQLIAKQHNGKITWQRDNNLTRFTFEFPSIS